MTIEKSKYNSNIAPGESCLIYGHNSHSNRGFSLRFLQGFSLRKTWQQPNQRGSLDVIRPGITCPPRLRKSRGERDSKGVKPQQ